MYLICIVPFVQDACPGGHAPKAALQYFQFFALYNLAARQLIQV